LTVQRPHEIQSIAELPAVPAVYALYGGAGQGLYVAYVGIAGALRARIMQHLVNRDSSIATGTSAVGLNPDQVTEVRWWQHPEFVQRTVLEAAELVAFDVLDPALRSRGGIRGEANRLYGSDEFRAGMRSLLVGRPAGRLVLPRLVDALARIAALERRVEQLEAQLTAVKARQVHAG
jgi:hypothetical protein